MAAPGVADADILTEVPNSLTRLLKCIVRGFYGLEHSILIDLLVRNPCVKEDDIVEVLKFDRKYLRQLIATLKNDHILRCRLRVETQPDGKTLKHNYYFINYRTFVNVVKYKLHHMQKKIESEARELTSRASFKCLTCEKTYTDLDTGQLFDVTTGEMRCIHCGDVVEEDETSTPQQDALMQIRFNEQMKPLYDLLREVEDVKLAMNILEPDPTDMTRILTRIGAVNHTKALAASTGVWSGDKHQGYNLYGSNAGITVQVGDKNKAPKSVVVKEQPVWMVKSTVDPVSVPTEPAVHAPVVAQPVTKEDFPEANQDIVQALIQHESRQAILPLNPIIPGFNNPTEHKIEPNHISDQHGAMLIQSMSAHRADEDMWTISVGGIRISLHDITEEIVQRMTPAEKDVYIKLSQRHYADMYE